MLEPQSPHSFCNDFVICAAYYVIQSSIANIFYFVSQTLNEKVGDGY